MSSSKASLIGIVTAFLLHFVIAQGTPIDTAPASASSAALVLPPCAISCFETAIMEDGCALTDLSCHCSRTSELAVDLGPCVTDQCTLADGYAFSNAFEEICSEFGSSSTPLIVTTSGSSPVVPTTVASVSVSSLPSTTGSLTPTTLSTFSSLALASPSSTTSTLARPVISTLPTSTTVVATSTASANADQSKSSVTPVGPSFSTSTTEPERPVSLSTNVFTSTVIGTSVVPSTQVVLTPHSTAVYSAPGSAVNGTGNINGTFTSTPIIYSSAAESGVTGYRIEAVIMLQILYSFGVMLL